MIAEPNCSKRKCKYFLGVKSSIMGEIGQFLICSAFPSSGPGIPREIAFGDNLHLEPVDDDHGIQYEGPDPQGDSLTP